MKVLDWDYSIEAQKDLDDIYEHSFEHFGYLQAELYINEIERIAIQLFQFNKEGKSRNDLQKNIRSIPQGKHTLFYKVEHSKLIIVRILHQSVDAPEKFKK